MTRDDIQELKTLVAVLSNKSAYEKGDVDYCIDSLKHIIYKQENPPKINHEANFMKQLVEAKKKMNSDVTLFEWNKELNRWDSNIIETAWCAYRMAVFDITGEVV